jgi:AcrR family transcriptional regulator
MANRISVNKTSSTAPSTRGKETREALMRAVEQLAAEKGLAYISIREILSKANQKNESALQYHFGNLAGLIDTLRQSRFTEVVNERTDQLARLLASTDQPSLRQLCAVMVMPPFQIAKQSPDFRRYIRAFGHELTQADDETLKHYNRNLGPSARETGHLLRLALPHLEASVFDVRMNYALRLATSAMVDQAKQPRAFQGKAGELFIESLIDAIQALLQAPVSPETQAAFEAVRRKN